jgi:uncharacterized protein (DUF1697 family)
VARYVALLRSVNVAGHGRLSMDELRRSFVSLGYEDVTTYIQTGNVLFRSDARQVPAVVAAVEQQLARDFGRSPAVIVRTVAHLLRVGTSSPFAARGADPARHHVTFLATRPSAEVVAGLDPPPSGRDELVVDGTEVYVHTPDGYAGTKYSGAFLERRLSVLSTTRNWNTVTKLCAMAVAR